MTYLFRSKATGDVLMLGTTGDQLLSIMGRQPATTGIIEPAAMPAAIKAIEDAVAREESGQARVKEAELGTDPHDPQEAVTLRQRAWPLLEMMKSAHAAAVEIVWGV
jgi:hypothetical protein